MHHLLSVLLIGLLTFPVSETAAFEINEVKLEYGKILQRERFDVQHWGVGIGHDFWHSTSQAFSTSTRFRAGRIAVGDDAAVLLGGGLGAKYAMMERLSINAAVDLIWLSRYEFVYDMNTRVADIGGPMQILTEIGLDFGLSKNISLGFYITHISNAHFYDSNPGIDLQQLILKYRF